MAQRPRLRLVHSGERPARAVAPVRPPGRYDDLSDRRLAAVLAAEDTAQEHGLSPHVRTTCHVHRCWVHECVQNPLHIIIVTGHRWCRRCDNAIDVEVDERLPGGVRLTCRGCGHTPDSAANREVLHACRTSLAAMRGGESADLFSIPPV